MPNKEKEDILQMRNPLTLALAKLITLGLGLLLGFVMVKFGKWLSKTI